MDREQGRRRSAEQDASSRVRAERAQSEPGEVSYLVIGRIVAPRGIHGELRIAIETEDPERFLLLSQVHLGEEHALFKVTRARLFRRQAHLQLDGIPSREAAEAWRGAYVFVHIDDALPLGEDEYYHHQIRGLRVISVQGETLGEVTEILSTGANDVYVVRGAGPELLLPAIEGVVERVDLDERIMVVRVPEGLR